MAGILMGVLLLGWGALVAARALLDVVGVRTPRVRRLVVPAVVWLCGGLVLVAAVPHTQLLEDGHRHALIGSLILLTLVCMISPLNHVRQHRAEQTANTGNSW